ncbi:unnamed protein product [Sphagnum jensenii]|uniref:Uncharacterized protein n=1 Tax=Sphagnum jensenii TaxID=128206 RepID=A0ABP1BQ39_9BRYO
MQDAKRQGLNESSDENQTDEPRSQQWQRCRLQCYNSAGAVARNAAIVAIAMALSAHGYCGVLRHCCYAALRHGATAATAMALRLRLLQCCRSAAVVLLLLHVAVLLRCCCCCGAVATVATLRLLQCCCCAVAVGATALLVL